MTEQVVYRNPVKAAGHAQIYHMATLDDRISNGAYRLFAVYIMHAQQKDICWPGRKRISEMLKCSEATVTRYNQELIKAGYITKQRRLNTSSLTYIEDLEQDPILQDQALVHLRGRTSEPTVSAPMSHVSAQECAVKKNKIEKEEVEEAASSDAESNDSPLDNSPEMGYNEKEPIKVIRYPEDEEFRCPNPYCDRTVNWASLIKRKAVCPYCGQYIAGYELGDSRPTWKPPKVARKKLELGNIIPDCPQKLSDIMYYKKQEKVILLLLEQGKETFLDSLNWAVNKYGRNEMEYTQVVTNAITAAQRKLKSAPAPEPQKKRKVTVRPREVSTAVPSFVTRWDEE